MILSDGVKTGWLNWYCALGRFGVNIGTLSCHFGEASGLIGDGIFDACSGSNACWGGFHGGDGFAFSAG